MRMSEKETGGPAFPHQKDDGTPYWGMTLRDYFAGQALAGTGSVNYHTIKEMAETCYKIADAMLEARK